ncbi:hypothetical protein AYO04_27570 [Raoultella planticola]|nr:hypothetical protein AYO04_27570 [Raoultella planticola]OAZ82294.1 hypothetical protein AYO05_18610 [Raoultella planticola]
MLFLISLALPDDVSCIDGVPAPAVITGMSTVAAFVIAWNGWRATGNPVKHLLTEAIAPPRT